MTICPVVFSLPTTQYSLVIEMELKNRITGSENLGAIFNVFHDGTIERAVHENRNIQLDVSIFYLAERVNPSYEFFYVILHNVQFFTYTPWGNDPVPETYVLTDLDRISAKALEILSSTVTPQGIEVLCLENFHQGGTLAFNADYAIVRDQGGNELSLVQLIALTEAYWSKLQ